MHFTHTHKPRIIIKVFSPFQKPDQLETVYVHCRQQNAILGFGPNFDNNVLEPQLQRDVLPILFKSAWKHICVRRTESRYRSSPHHPITHFRTQLSYNILCNTEMFSLVIEPLVHIIGKKWFGCTFVETAPE
ncbi:hypothetical protein QTP88_007817 [Uroleucon formosanum]